MTDKTSVYTKILDNWENVIEDVKKIDAKSIAGASIGRKKIVPTLMKILNKPEEEVKEILHKDNSYFKIEHGRVKLHRTGLSQVLRRLEEKYPNFDSDKWKKKRSIRKECYKKRASLKDNAIKMSKDILQDYNSLENESQEHLYTKLLKLALITLKSHNRNEYRSVKDIKTIESIVEKDVSGLDKIKELVNSNTNEAEVKKQLKSLLKK